MCLIEFISTDDQVLYYGAPCDVEGLMESTIPRLLEWKIFSGGVSWYPGSWQILPWRTWFCSQPPTWTGGGATEDQESSRQELAVPPVFIYSFVYFCFLSFFQEYHTNEWISKQTDNPQWCSDVFGTTEIISFDYIAIAPPSSVKLSHLS